MHLTGIEPALSFKNMDLNHTRLPVPPQVHDLIFTAGALPRDSCGARNFLHLGAVQNFDRGAFSALASSAAGGARLKTASSATGA